MNKILTLIALLVWGGFTSAQNTIGLVKGSEATFYADENLPDGFKSCKFQFYNKGDKDITIEYRQVELDFPESWLISFCDNRDCLPNFPLIGTYSPIKPGDTTEFKLDVFPSGGADSALIKYAIWDKNLPNLIDTLVYRVYARWGLNVQSMSHFNTRIFPNPVQGTELVVSGTAISNVQILSTDGRVMLNQDGNSLNELRLNLERLSNGHYYIQVRHAAGMDSHSLQLNR